MTAARSSPSRRTSTEAAGRRQHPGYQRVSPLAGDPGGERGLQHRPGLARVADDQDLRALGGRLEGRGAAQRQCELGGQQLARDPSDAVGAEQPARQGG